MDSASLDFFQRILETPSPSGYEKPVQDLVREYAAGFADEVTTDLHGNVIACKNSGGSPRIMLAGHCDQIGLLVQHIDEQGFLYVQPIGGWDPQILVGQRMTVWTDKGAVPGIVSRKPIHLLTEEERKQVVKMKDLWVDIGVRDKAEAAELVRVRDPITFELGLRRMQDNNLAFAPAMDNKTGLWVAMEALRRAAGRKLRCALYAVSTVQEEIGLRGAQTSTYGIDPQVGIAIDVTHATDCPTIDKKQEGDVALGKGPVIYRGPNMNHKVVERLIAAADGHEIAYQLGAVSRPTGTDANAMQISRAGVATGLISIPNRYMHSPVEMIAMDDIDRAADLIAYFAAEVDSESVFTP